VPGSNLSAAWIISPGRTPGRSLRSGSGDHELAEQVRDKSLGIPFRGRMQRKAGGQLWVRLQLGQVLWGWNRSWGGSRDRS
jgi:hypothetical protein